MLEIDGATTDDRVDWCRRMSRDERYGAEWPRAKECAEQCHGDAFEQRRGFGLTPLVAPRRESCVNRFSLRCAAAFALLTIALTGCGPKTATWSEEVRLQSGDVLTVQRSMKFKAYQPAGGGGGADILESTLEIIAPALADAPARWSGAPLLPLVFDRDEANQEWFIVATFYLCTAWYDLGRPKLPYAEFRYRGGRWVQQPLSEKFIGRAGNMLVPNQADTGRNHSIASKADLMRDPATAEEYRRVVATWTTHC